jgi:ATP-dependent Lhr-like helicase
MVERLREKLSTEKLADRLARIVADAEQQLSHDPPAPRRPSRSRSRQRAPAD